MEAFSATNSRKFLSIENLALSRDIWKSLGDNYTFKGAK